MHFIDRNSVLNPPIDILIRLDKKYKVEWINYYNSKIEAKKNKTKNNYRRPTSAWNIVEIKNPLKLLFYKNCGYCGIHTDTGNDAEVDHFFPASEDANAEHVFRWDNYIWSCPACNRSKRDNYYVLDPCDKNDMDYIFFNATTGLYLCKKGAPENIKERYNLTNEKTNLNRKNRPSLRNFIYRNLHNNFFPSLKIASAKLLIYDNTTDEYNEAITEIDLIKEELIALVNSGNHLFLIEFIFTEYCQKNEIDLPFSFQDLLNESGYLI